MAKTDWQLGDTVQPEDLNQLGQEINDNTSAISEHIAATTGVHGATSEAMPNTIVQRDFAGRVKANGVNFENGSRIGDEQHRTYIRTSGNRFDAVTSDGQNYVLSARADTDELYFKSNKIFHSGNDGSGSGLDADMVDGFQANQLAKKNPGNEILLRWATNELQIDVDSTQNLPVAKANSVNGWRIYNDITELGLTPGSETMEDIVIAMANRSMLIFWKTTTNASSAYPANTGLLIVTKYHNTRVVLEFFSRESGISAVWVGYYDSNQTPNFTGWNKVAVTDSINEFLGIQKFQARASDNHAGTQLLDPNGRLVGAYYYQMPTGRLIMRKYTPSTGEIESDLWIQATEFKYRVFNNSYDVWHSGNLPYETGNWTPVVKFGGNNDGLSYVHRYGRYTRIGNTVYWVVYVGLQTKGTSTGAVTIEGLPFVSHAGLPISVSVGVVESASLPANVYGIQYMVLNNDNKITLRVLGSNISNTALTSSTLADTSHFRASGFYYIS